MRTRALAAISTLLMGTSSCPRPLVCSTASIPTPHATGVPSDVQIELAVAPDSLPWDVPTEGSFTLTDLDEGAAVDIAVRAEPDQDRIFIRPTQPLPAHRFELVGSANVRRPHFDADRLVPQYTHVEFTVGGTPRLVDVFAREGTLYVAFSEPVDVDTLASGLQLWPKVSTTSGPTLVDGTDRVYQIGLGGADLQRQEEYTVTLVGVTSLRGVRLANGVAELADPQRARGRTDVLDAYRGEASCGLL